LRSSVSTGGAAAPPAPREAAPPVRVASWAARAAAVAAAAAAASAVLASAEALRLAMAAPPTRLRPQLAASPPQPPRSKPSYVRSAAVCSTKGDERLLAVRKVPPCGA